jgi:hypothetical protein
MLTSRERRSDDDAAAIAAWVGRIAAAWRKGVEGSWKRADLGQRLVSIFVESGRGTDFAIGVHGDDLEAAERGRVEGGDR